MSRNVRKHTPDISAQWRLQSPCASARADLNLRLVHLSEHTFSDSNEELPVNCNECLHFFIYHKTFSSHWPGHWLAYRKLAPRNSLNLSWKNIWVCECVWSNDVVICLHVKAWELVPVSYWCITISGMCNVCRLMHFNERNHPKCTVMTVCEIQI